MGSEFEKEEKTEEKAEEKTEPGTEPEKVVLSATAAGEEDEDDGQPNDAESTAIFAPVVKLEEVEVRNHEEDEDVLFLQRAKLFTYGENMLDKGTGNKKWNERGVGDCKILKHRENSRIRVLMRQEKTLKIICNHLIDPRIKLEPNQTASDRSWVWCAFDFAEGVLEEKTFALRFKDSEQAQEFKTKFQESQVEMQREVDALDSTEGGEEASQLAESLENVAVKDGEATEASPPETNPDK